MTPVMSSLRRETFPVGPLGANCTVLGCPRTHDGLVVDPGGDADLVLAAVRRLGLKPSHIVLTHGHYDHILAVGTVAAATEAPIGLHAGDRFLYDGVDMQAATIGLPAAPKLPPPDRELRHGDVLRFGDLEAEVVHTPGHSPGSLCLLLRSESLLLAGDTLFRRGVGRTDLWGGSEAQLERSIRDRLFTLPEDVEVVAGHGPSTTIGLERLHNPYVRA